MILVLYKEALFMFTLYIYPLLYDAKLIQRKNICIFLSLSAPKGEAGVAITTPQRLVYIWRCWCVDLKILYLYF